MQTSLCARKAWAAAEAGSRLTSNQPQSNAFTHKRFVSDQEDTTLLRQMQVSRPGCTVVAFLCLHGDDSTE